MLSIKSLYRSIGNDQIEYNSLDSGKSQIITPGICDYIPKNYFERLFFSIYIEGSDLNQIIRFILWNQYYEKTLLKQIFFQLSINYRKAQSTLIQKLDNKMTNVTNNEIIYLKIKSKVYNLKDKLDYKSCQSLEKQIKQSQSLSIQKISQEGKWKKITIDFGPYKNKDQFDIVFACSSLNQNQNKQNDNPISSKMQNKSNKKRSKQNKQNATGRKQIQKRSNSKTNLNCFPFQKSKNQSNRKLSNVHSSKKFVSKQQNSKSSSKRSSKHQSSDLMKSNTSKKSNSSGISHKKINQIFQSTPNDKGVLKEVNFNSTAKLFLAQKLNLCEDGIAPVSLDLKRKQKFKVKPNSFLQVESMIPLQSEYINKFSQSNKNNAVLAQILSKKEQIIFSQKRKMQQNDLKYYKQMQQIKLKHGRQTQQFRSQITTILNQYNTKYENQKQQCKQLRNEVKNLQSIISQNKVLITQLQVKYKSGEDQAKQYKNQLEGMKKDCKQMQQKYQQLLIQSKEQHSKLINEKNQSNNQKEKYLKKYTQLSKKVKYLIHEQDNIL